MKPTKDRTKLAAVWLPADVMRDKHHKRECTYSRVIHYDDGSAEVDESCICDRLRACEERVLDAAREAVAALEPLLGRSKHEGGYDCCGCATIDYLWTDALDAIDALKESK